MGALQKVPPGILPALDLKSLGRNPTDFSETVIGVVDLLDSYCANLQTLATSANLAGSGVAGQQAQAFCPNGILWRVRTLHATMVCPAAFAAAAGITLSAGVFLSGNSTFCITLRTEAIAALAGVAIFRASVALPVPIYVPAGSGITAESGTTTSAYTQLAISALVEALPV